MDVDLVYFEGCPNITKARERLLVAFKGAGIPPRWQEWKTDDPESPKRVHGWGSPTILVDGLDVAGLREPDKNASCRVYIGLNGKMDGAPSVEITKDALLAAAVNHDPEDALPDKSRWAVLLALFPAVGAALMPTCPACWPIYAGLFASFGIEFTEDSPYVAPLIILFLLIALAALGYRAQARRGYGPLFLGTSGTVLVLISKFAIVSSWLLHGGVVLMLGAFVWNVWSRKGQVDSGVACPACLPKGKIIPIKETA